MIHRYLIAAALLACGASAQNTGALVVIPKSDDSATGYVQFNERRTNGSNYGRLSAPAAFASNRTWTWMDASGTVPLLESTNTWTAVNYYTSEIRLNSNNLTYYRAAGGADEKYWRLDAQGGPMTLQTLNDAYTATGTAWTIDRSGNTPTNMTFSMNLYPSGTRDLGAITAGFRWNNLHLDSGLYMGGTQMIDSSRNVANVNTFQAVGSVQGGAATFASVRASAGILAVGGTNTVADTLSASDRTLYAKEIYIGTFGSSPVRIVDTSRNATFAALTVTSCSGCATGYLTTSAAAATYAALSGATMTGNLYTGASAGSPTSVLPPARTSGLDGLGSIGNATNPYANVTAAKIELIDTGTAFGTTAAFMFLKAQANSGAQFIGFYDTSSTAMLSLTRVFGSSTVNTASFDLHVIPTATNTRTLGSSGNQWDGVYGRVFYGNGNTGATLAVSCASGQAIKTLTAYGGIITAATCGVP
jgi:hypothetical protein